MGDFPGSLRTVVLAVVGETSTVSAAMTTLIPLRTVLEALVS
jgi:hypothetical protein